MGAKCRYSQNGRTYNSDFNSSTVPRSDALRIELGQFSAMCHACSAPHFVEGPQYRACSGVDANQGEPLLRPKRGSANSRQKTGLRSS